MNGRVLVLQPKIGGEAHAILDLLPLVDIDPDAPGERVPVFRGGAPAAYADSLQSGDIVQISLKSTAAAEE